MDIHTRSYFTEQQQQQVLTSRVPVCESPFVLTDFATSTSGVHRDGTRSKAAATPPCMLAVRTDERRNGPGREYAPYLKGSEDCQGRVVGARDELHGDDPGPLLPPPPTPTHPLPSRSSSAISKKNQAGGGQVRSWTLRRRAGLGGTLAST